MDGWMDGMYSNSVSTKYSEYVEETGIGTQCSKSVEHMVERRSIVLFLFLELRVRVQRSHPSETSSGDSGFTRPGRAII